MTNLITAQDISDFMPDVDTSSFTATTLSGIISQATHEITKFCQLDGFEYADYDSTARARISNKGELVISPRVRNIETVNSVTLLRGGFSVALTLTSNGTNLYQIPSPGNRIHIPNSYLYMTGTYLAGGASQLLALRFADLFCEVNVKAGYQTIPDDLKNACLLWVQDIIVRRRLNRAGAMRFRQGSLDIQFAPNNGMNPGDSDIIMEAKRILYSGDYVRVEVF